MVLLALSYAGVIHTPPPPVFQASAYLALSPFSLVTSRCRSAPSGVLVGQVPNQPLGALSSKVESPLGAGIEYHRHTWSPVMALYAVTWPRMPYSPPDTPTMTLSPMMSGAWVMLYPKAGSATSLSQRTLPSLASKAMRWASSVPMYTWAPPWMPTPRLFGPQQVMVL